MCVRVCLGPHPVGPSIPYRAIEDREQMCVKRARLQGKDTTRDEMIMIARELLRKTRLSRLGNHHPSHKRVENWFRAVVVVRALALFFACIGANVTALGSVREQNKVKKKDENESFVFV